MVLGFSIPQDQMIHAAANGFGLVRVEFATGHFQTYRCYPADFSDPDRNKPCVKQWFDAGNPMPDVVPYAPPPVLTESELARSALRESDTGFVRVLEDLLDALIDTGVLDAADLPGAARAKIAERKALRENL